MNVMNTSFRVSQSVLNICKAQSHWQREKGQNCACETVIIQ